MDFNLISILLFYGLALLFIIHYRKRIEFNKGVVIFRTKKPLRWIDRIARFKRFWRVWGLISIVIGFIGMVGIFSLLLASMVRVLSQPEITEPSVQVIIPWFEAGSAGPLLFIPFWYVIISLIILIIVHEGSHGVVARANKLKLKSAGAGLLFILPFAFVEPDEEQLQKTKLTKKLSVFAAGSFANFCVAILTALLLFLVVSPAWASVSQPDGILILEVQKGLPADLAGLTPQDMVVGANGRPINTTTDLIEIFGALKPGDTINLTTSTGKVAMVKTIPNPKNASRAYLGITFEQHFVLKPEYRDKPYLFKLYNLHWLLYWILILNAGIGLINLLPLGPLDGGRMLKAVLDAKIKNKKLAQEVFMYISLISLVSLILSIFGPMLF